MDQDCTIMSFMNLFDIHPRFNQMSRQDKLRRTNLLCSSLTNPKSQESFKRADTFLAFTDEMEMMATDAIWGAGERQVSASFFNYFSDPPAPTWAPACHPPRPQELLVLAPSLVDQFRTHLNPFWGYGDYILPLPHDQIKTISYNLSKILAPELYPLWMAVEFSHVTNGGLLEKNNESLLMLRPRNNKRSTAAPLLRMWGLVLAWFHREILLKGLQDNPPRVECPEKIVPFEAFLAGLADWDGLESIIIEDEVEGIRALIDTGILNVRAVARQK
ncbi:hypothetical protein PspLS_09385 [Pyricularia sp. CBS 133598]|nr:hypothetical protein PspLS_09385 [Pyricularia sp. CBS 133598]